MVKDPRIPLPYIRAYEPTGALSAPYEHLRDLRVLRGEMHVSALVAA
jgi:hypothetical protein